MVPSPPEFEITWPIGNTGTILAGEEIAIRIAAEPGIEDYLNSLPLKVVFSNEDLTPETSNFVYDDISQEYVMYSKSTSMGIQSGDGYVQLGEKRSEFHRTVGS